MKKLLVTALVAGALTTLAGCNSNAPKETAQAPQLNNDDLYEVQHEGRYYVFDDFATYQSFLEVGETSYRKVFIGGGPHGETLVYGLTGADKKKSSGIASIEMFNGEMAGAEDFYGEMQGEDGRLYVFSRLEDMESVRQTGEAPYRFTQIGAGQNGETLVFVLHGGNKKHQPVELMAKYKAKHQL